MVLASVLAAALLGCGDGPLLFDVTVHQPDAVEAGLILGTSFDGSSSSVFLVDREGRARWLRHLPTGFVTANAITNGRHLLYDDMLGSGGYGHIRQLSLEGVDDEPIEVHALHHSFTQTPDGSLAWLEVDIRDTWQWGPVVGDRIVERGPDGTERVVTSLWDHLPVTTHGFFDETYYPQGKDWTHCNGITYDTHSDRYVVTSRNLGAVLEIDRHTGDMVRYLDASNLAGQTLYAPHAARWTPQGTLLLVSSAPDDTATWASELAVHHDGSLQEIWSHGRDDDLFAHAKGEARRLDGGNTLVNWGSAGMIREIAPDGTVVWEARVVGDDFLGTTTLVDADAVAGVTGP